jgi:hypothetical protein
MVMATAQRVRQLILRKRHGHGQSQCYSGHCACSAVEALQETFPVDVPHSAVYTKTDGIVDWRVCINDDPTTNFEVQGTHIGLVFNHQVYQVMANQLARK